MRYFFLSLLLVLMMPFDTEACGKRRAARQAAMSGGNCSGSQMQSYGYGYPMQSGTCTINGMTCVEVQPGVYMQMAPQQQYITPTPQQAPAVQRNEEEVHYISITVERPRQAPPPIRRPPQAPSAIN